MCPPVSPYKGASIVSGRASCAMHKHFNAWKRRLYGWGDVPFADGNAAARTFGRAHRHRPYGFVWVDCACVVGDVWVDCTWNG